MGGSANGVCPGESALGELMIFVFLGREGIEEGFVEEGFVPPAVQKRPSGPFWGTWGGWTLCKKQRSRPLV